MTTRLIIATLLLPLLGHAGEPAPVIQQVTISATLDPEWSSYRRAYKNSAWSATFTRTRPLIQAHMQICPVRPEYSMDGLRVHLVGETSSVDIAVDAIGRAVLPMLKQAYDEDAVLQLNRQKGNYYMGATRFSIKEHEDGLYNGAELRAACEQLLDAERGSGSRMRLIGKSCAGVSFVYPRDAASASIAVATKAGAHHDVSGVDELPFEDRAMGLYKIVSYRFSDWPDQSTVQTRERPLAIAPLYQ